MENQDNNYKRPSWDEYFMEILAVIGRRGTCDRGRSGCVIVNDRRIVSTGYAGAPAGLKHCDEVGHEMNTVKHEDGHESRHCVRTTHAEQNAIVTAARFGIKLEGSTMYTKMTPCYACAKMIINAGIKRVVCQEDYHAGERTKEVFTEAGVQYNLLNAKTTEYEDQ